MEGGNSRLNALANAAFNEAFIYTGLYELSTKRSLVRLLGR